MNFRLAARTALLKTRAGIQAKVMVQSWNQLTIASYDTTLEPQENLNKYNSVTVLRSNVM